MRLRGAIINRTLTLAILLTFLSPPVYSAQRSDRIQLQLDSSEAAAVLSILDKRAQRTTVTEADWQKLFATVPYQRLKQRETSMRRPFSDEEFKTFVSTLDSHRQQLHDTLNAWAKADLYSAAERTFQYLPAGAAIKAAVYPVIKPQKNSFVFEPDTNPSIFLYLDASVSSAQFENTVAHELHHIGLSSLDASYEQRIESLPENAHKAALWMGAFGEGMAVLAAAGSPDVPPLAAYPPRDQTAWEVDYERATSDLDDLNQFFLDVLHGDIKGDAVKHVASTFFGHRGPWYTVGYLMATTIERQFGRAALVETFGDAREFVAKYNLAASAHNAKGPDKLPLFSGELLQGVGVKSDGSTVNK